MSQTGMITSLFLNIIVLIHYTKVTHCFANRYLNFGRCLSELDQLVPIPYFQGRSTHISDRLHDISATILRYYLDVSMSTVPFPAQLETGFSVYRMLSFDI